MIDFASTLPNCANRHRYGLLQERDRFEILKTNKGFAPLLLLDDVFEKLDDKRMQQLLHWVCNENEGQVFITDTHKERLEEAFEKLNTAYQIIEL